MIRNVILHLNSEQPLLADLYEAPSPGDVGLRCTNLRMMNGKRPVFVDDIKSIFFFPYLHIRFVEIPPAAMSGSDSSLALESNGEEEPEAASALPEVEPDLEIDEDFLRRIREV
ncbi:MAG: hypothetical protein ABJC39_08045 [Chloroflexota bacterium]